MARNVVFISYPREDAIIADKVMAAIMAFPGNKFDIFLDRNYIKGGQSISGVIKDSLKKSVYFVAIGTDVSRRNFDWCGQELGFYQGSHTDNNRRETCLYHASIPELFAGIKSFRAQSLLVQHRDEFGDPVVPLVESEFYEFLIDLANLHTNVHPPNDVTVLAQIPQWARTWASELVDGFFEALQTREKNAWYPQGRVELSIPDGNFYKRIDQRIPEDADVLLSSSMYNILARAVPDPIRKQTWASFCGMTAEASGSDTLCRIMNDVIVSALPARAEAKNDYVFQAPNQRFYRVLLVKHTVFGNGRRDLVLNVVETLDRVRGGDRATTVLVAGIILGSRYRSIFLESGAKYGTKALSTLSDDALKDRLMALLRDIDLINADASSDGLSDYAALEDLLGSKDDVKALFARWWEVFPALERDAKRFVADPVLKNRETFFTSHGHFIEASRENNTTFLRLCLDRYRTHLE